MVAPGQRRDDHSAPQDRITLNDEDDAPLGLPPFLAGTGLLSKADRRRGSSREELARFRTRLLRAVARVEPIDRVLGDGNRRVSALAPHELIALSNHAFKSSFLDATCAL